MDLPPARCWSLRRMLMIRHCGENQTKKPRSEMERRSRGEGSPTWSRRARSANAMGRRSRLEDFLADISGRRVGRARSAETAQAGRPRLSAWLTGLDRTRFRRDPVPAGEPAPERVCPRRMAALERRLRLSEVTDHPGSLGWREPFSQRSAHRAQASSDPLGSNSPARPQRT